jgi:predicted alpha-1,2-mannosidase
MKIHKAMAKPGRYAAAIRLLLSISAPFAALAQTLALADESHLQYVNILQGTDSTKEFSHGNTLPLIGTPWGMTDWTLQTKGDLNEHWFFSPKDSKLIGFRATHHPSPWMGDYGNFLILPQTGRFNADFKSRGADYDLATRIFKPDYIKVDLSAQNIITEVTASERCGCFRFNFENSKSGRVLFDVAGQSQVTFFGRSVRGFSKEKMPRGSVCFFAGTFDRDMAAAKSYGDGSGKSGSGGYAEFDTATNRMVELRIATSYISYDQAELNLQRETESGFEGVRSATARLWEDNLSRVEIEASDAQKRTFYSCLYRALNFPHRFFEISSNGAAIHFSPFDGRVHAGVEFVGSGLWDTFRTQYPLYTVVYPHQFGEIVAGWLNAYKENGRLPQWPSPGDRAAMIGTHSDAMIADAVVKGIKGFDPQLAYEAIRNDAFGDARKGIKEYLTLGYIPISKGRYYVSEGLDYAYDDWCVAQVAKLLGKENDYVTLIKRAGNYKLQWDSNVGFMRGKDASGNWDSSPFDEYLWGGAYVEGGPWQCSWAVQHDVAGLASLMGGQKEFAAKLDQLFSQPATCHSGNKGYPKVIHEMSEMVPLHMGQCSLNNQPSFHIPYLYAAIGQPWKTEYWTRFACQNLFNDGIKGYPGDEDNGSTASWYVLSAMGIYSLTPGHPSFVLTSPLFPKITIHLENGRDLVINAPGNTSETVYVQNRSLNGKPYRNLAIAYSDLMNGGIMDVKPGKTPHKTDYKITELPYSLSLEHK